MIALLVASIAVGRGYMEVHAASDADAARWSQILAKRGSTLQAELERERCITEAVEREAANGSCFCYPTSGTSIPTFAWQSPKHLESIPRFVPRPSRR